LAITSSLDDTFAIKGCNLLIRVLDDQISELEYDEHKKITWRLKMVLVSQELKNPK
jgi:hypothetical protein